MSEKRKGLFRNSYSSRSIFIAMLFLAIYGSFMIISAAMPSATGQTDILISTGMRQSFFFILAIIAFLFFERFDILLFSRNMFYIAYVILAFALLLTRAFGSSGGAYGWLYFGPFSIQPAEFAKVFVIIFGAKMFSRDSKKNNLKYFKTYGFLSAIYFIIIAFYQHDFGSGAVLLVISYCIMLIPPYEEYKTYQTYMIIGMLIVVALALLALSPWGTNFLSSLSSSNYMIARFLSAANPFKYLYDDGYHLVMSLVSFASGGLFGMGYGNSIHKYMNFPSPTTDFIFPVIVEELGIVFGLLPVLIGYGFMLVPLYRYSLRTKSTPSKIILLGVFMYFAAHFIFNVGGVSGLIPLTGVPLLLLSSGGTSLLACMAALGICENEIIKFNKGKKDASDSRQI